MPKLNLLESITQGSQSAEVNQGSVEVINGYAERFPRRTILKTRPGLELLETIGTSARVDTYWWEAKKVLIIVCGSKIYYKTSITAPLIEITPVAEGDRIAFNTKVMFTSDTYGVTMTTGQHMIWWNSVDANCIRVTDSNAPTEITGITYLKGYLIASINNSQNFAWATYSPLDNRSLPPVWSASRLSASASPDDLICLASGWEELLLLGMGSAESQYVTGDATIPFKSLQGSAAEVGIINNKCLVKLRNTWVFLTPNRQVVVLQGRMPKVISKSIEGALRELESFEDVETLILFERFCVFNFFTDGKTFVFDVEMNLWYRWEYWDNRIKKYKNYLGVTATLAKTWGIQIVGSSTGKLYKADYEFLKDGEEFIRGQVLTANIDHETLDRKFVNTIKLRLRRGY